jgi:hypothetical protein
MTESEIALLVVTKDAPRSVAGAVRSSRLPPSRVIVVSNDSCDAANAEIAKSLPGITLVKLHPARGLTYCWNIGLRRPAEAKWSPQPTWTVVANDDVVFDADWLRKMSNGIAEHPHALHIGMAYPKNRYSCFVVHRNLIRSIGWFDERFTGMFYEDDDWHFRLCEYARCAPGTRVSERDKNGVFAVVPCVLHDHAANRARAKDRARFGFKTSLSKAPNKEFFYKKWKRVEKGGWLGKGLPGNFKRRLHEVEWYPMALLGGALK